LAGSAAVVVVVLPAVGSDPVGLWNAVSGEEAPPAGEDGAGQLVIRPSQSGRTLFFVVVGGKERK
jgi:hypothetical protein